MGLTCSRRLPPGWEKIQADLDEAVRGGDPDRIDRVRQQARRAGLLQQDGDAPSAAEARLKQALRSGDARLIERACNEAEAEGLEKAKLSLARAEAQWLSARAALEEAVSSGDPQRVAKATRDAELAGVDPSRVSADRRGGSAPARVGGAGAELCSVAGVREFLAVRATMGAAVSVLLYEWSAYNFVFLGRILPAMGKELFVVPFGLVFNAAWLLAMCSFVRCHFADPGSVPRRWHEFVGRMGDALPVAPARLEWQPGKATHCKRCETPRPERTHHCHVCGRCVLRMDHHCPWINNCVGFNNHKFFLLLVAYCFLASLVGLATACPELVYCVAALVKLQSGEQWEEEHVRLSDVLVFIIFGILALLFAGLLAPMAITHFELAAYNITTIEGHYESANMPNPFDQGDMKANFAQLFGAYGPEWFIPVHPSRPLSDGVCFLRAGDSAGSEALLESGHECELDTAEDQLWRLRYQVRPTATPRDESAASPPRTPSFQWWWNRAGYRSDEEGDVAAGAGKKKMPKLHKSRILTDSAGRRVVSI